MLLAPTFVVQPAALVKEVIVTVVDPLEGSNEPGIANVPFDAPIVIVAVLPVDVLAPLRLKVTVKTLPVPSVLLFTVTVEFEPAHTVVALGEVKLVVFGFPRMLNVAVLLLETAVGHPEPVMLVIVIVVDPVVGIWPAGTVKVPLDAPIVSVAVLPEEVFEPLRL